MLTPLAAIREGFRQTRRVRGAIWILFWLNFGLAAIAGLPIYAGILRFTGHSLTNETLSQSSSVEWLTDFSINSPGSLTRYATVIGLMGLISMVVNAVLTGGVLGAFRLPQPEFSLQSFFHDAGRYCWRLLRLWLIGLVCYWIVFRVLHQALGNLVDRWSRDQPDGRPVFWVQLGATALLVVALAFVNLLMDYARVSLVMKDSPSAVSALRASLTFFATGLRQAMAVYAIPTLVSVALAGIYLAVAPWQESDRPWMLVLLFAAQQVLMFARYWLRVVTWASEWFYYGGANPDNS